MIDSTVLFYMYSTCSNLRCGDIKIVVLVLVDLVLVLPYGTVWACAVVDIDGSIIQKIWLPNFHGKFY